jgi:DNA adenine methylase
MPDPDTIPGNFGEHFLGSGAVFFAIQTKPAILNDKNVELIDLYRGIRYAPLQVWRRFHTYPSDKGAFYQARQQDTTGLSLIDRAARTLYLNRTCFKGMWRQNSRGMFNVGYGGQSRRWGITEDDLVDVAMALRGTTLSCKDFEEIIHDTKPGDFLFVDPPYHPGRRDSRVEHYMFSRFTFESHKRLAEALKRANQRGVRWAMTTSSHPDIATLHKDQRQIPFKSGVGASPGSITKITGEILVLNY